MPDLPARPDLDQLRRQAKDLLRSARNGDPAAAARLQATSVANGPNLSAAQLTVAREYGFVSWTKLKTEVERREILNDRDLDRLTAFIAEHPELATEQMSHWCDHPLGPTPLSYVAMLRYDTARRSWRDMPGTGAIARVLLQPGRGGRGHHRLATAGHARRRSRPGTGDGRRPRTPRCRRPAPRRRNPDRRHRSVGPPTAAHSGDER
jgi:hypothetical protein